MNSPYGVNNLAVMAALASLQDQDYVKDYAVQVKKNRKYLLEELGNMGLKTYETDANFILVRLGDKKDCVVEALGERGILVRNMGRYPLLSDCIRITIGTKEQMKRLLNELKTILGGMSE